MIGQPCVTCFHKLSALQRWTHVAPKACGTFEGVWRIRASLLILHLLRGGQERYAYSLRTFSVSDLCVFHCQASITCGGRLWNNAAVKITFQCPISCLSARMKLPYKHHRASWLSELRSFVRDWAAKSILAFLCQRLCPYMMMSLLPVSGLWGETHFHSRDGRC